MRGKIIAIILLSFVAGAGIAFTLHVMPLPGGMSGPLSGNGSKTTGKALIGGPFTMVDQDGKVVTEKNLAGRFTLIFFGFTHCPDVCPASLQVTSEAMEKLGPLADKVVPVFVTVDPERDTPEAMKMYLSNFDPRMKGLTGSNEQVRKIARAYRIYYAKVEDPDSSDAYTVDHSALMYLMDTNGEYVVHFPYGTLSDALVERMRPILSRG